MTEIMKRCLSLGFALPVIFAGGARRTNQRPNGISPQPKEPGAIPMPSPAHVPERPSLTSFSGTVIRHGTRFALREGDGDLYALDSTGLAWPFEGEEVRISGYLNPGSGLLHICAIEEVDDLRAEAV